VTWATSVPISVFLGLSVLDLGPLYATDIRQTDVGRQTNCNPRPTATEVCSGVLGGAQCLRPMGAEAFNNWLAMYLKVYLATEATRCARLAVMFLRSGADSWTSVKLNVLAAVRWSQLRVEFDCTTVRRPLGSLPKEEKIFLLVCNDT